MSETLVEIREFKMHQALLGNVIKEQVGTVQKAILEAVMNSVDAGSTYTNVTIEPDHVRVIDDGRGFQSKLEVEEWFETFGTPHDEKDPLKRVYGKFRMGRGQLFAFGKNEWRTGEFRMTVDVDSFIGHRLESGLEAFPGCEINIDLYQALNPREIYDTVKEIGAFVRYVSVPVTVNGVVVSSPPEEKKFPHSIDEAFIKLRGKHLIFHGNT